MLYEKEIKVLFEIFKTCKLMYLWYVRIEFNLSKKETILRKISKKHRQFYGTRGLKEILFEIVIDVVKPAKCVYNEVSMD